MDTTEPPLDRDFRVRPSPADEIDPLGSSRSQNPPSCHQSRAFSTVSSNENVTIGGDRLSHNSSKSTRRNRPSTSKSSQKKVSHNPPVRPHLSLGDPSLTRHGTLLTANATPARAAAELKSILGNHNARLKSKAALVRVDSGSAAFNRHVTLEQAKPRARVQVDILPQTIVCVQGGYLRGHVNVSIRKAMRKETPISIAGGKIRVIGFESFGDKSKAIFYQCSAMLASVSPSFDGLYASERDAEGFAQAKEGEHEFPFALYLSLSSDVGQAKGSLRSHSGVALNYIAMLSLKIKDESGRRSIAHFYRDIEVWPRLDPAVILAPALRPLQATVSTNISKDSKAGRIKLTASLHRLYWVAGQFCQVKIIVENGTSKTLKDLTISLHRTITIFPGSSSSGIDLNFDSRQPEVSTKQVAESVLEAGQAGIRGHASAKGWWLGIRPDRYSEFEHSILIPVDALTVPRGPFVEVEYSLRVAVDSCTRLTSDVQVMLPTRIVNFLSIDPPPSRLINAITQTPLPPRPTCSRQSTRVTVPRARTLGNSGNHSTPSADTYDRISVERDPRASMGKEMISSDSRCDSLPYEQDVDDLLSDWEDEPGNLELGNLSLADDTDDVVQHAVTTARVDLTFGRFSDLYHTQDQVETDVSSQDGTYERSSSNSGSDSVSGVLATLMEEVRMEIDSDVEKLTLPCLGAHRRSSFAARVEEKTRMATVTFLNGDRDGYNHQGQREHPPNSVQEDHQSGKPYFCLQNSPVLGGEKSQSSWDSDSQRIQQSHLCTSGGNSARTRQAGNSHDPSTKGESISSRTGARNSGPESLSTTPSTKFPPSTALPATESPRVLHTPLFHQDRQDITPMACVPLFSHSTRSITDSGAVHGGRLPSGTTRVDTQGKHIRDTSTDINTSLPHVAPTLHVCVDGIKATVTGGRHMSPASAASTASAASIGSVKDKVRQLEERVKVEASI